VDSDVPSAPSEEGVWTADPDAQAGMTPDPGDDCLVALARAGDADYLVSGDTHLTMLSNQRPPIFPSSSTPWNTQDDSGLDVDGRLALSRSSLLALGDPDALALSGLQDLLIE
jgi:hypothetical protein